MKLSLTQKTGLQVCSAKVPLPHNQILDFNAPTSYPFYTNSFPFYSSSPPLTMPKTLSREPACFSLQNKRHQHHSSGKPPKGFHCKIFLFSIHKIYLTTTDCVYGDIYLNVEGKILSNGDLSYQRQLNHILCSSNNFMKYIKTTLRME